MRALTSFAPLPPGLVPTPGGDLEPPDHPASHPHLGRPRIRRLEAGYCSFVAVVPRWIERFRRMETEIRLLGGFSARRKGEEIAAGAFGGRLTRRLLRILLTRRGEFVSRDFLTEALWPRTAPADPVMNLNVLVKRARSALGNPGLILTGAGGYLFARTERCVVDAEEFLAGVESAREPLAAGRTLGALRVALDHWGGEPLPEDAYEDWAQEYRTRLLRARLEALERGAEAALRVGDPRQAIPFAELAVIQEPF